MLDFRKITKEEYNIYFDTDNPEELTLHGFNSYVYDKGMENIFDKNLLIDWSKGPDGWEEIDSPKTWISNQLESNPDLFEDYDNGENLKKKLLENDYDKWDKECHEFFNSLDSSFVPQAMYEWSRVYVCYAYEIKNFKQDIVIGHDIYCVFDKYTLNDQFYKSYEELEKDLDKLFFISDWGKDFIQTNF